jgi:hypothetical protein
VTVIPEGSLAYLREVNVDCLGYASTTSTRIANTGKRRETAILSDEFKRAYAAGLISAGRVSVGVSRVRALAPTTEPARPILQATFDYASGQIDRRDLRTQSSRRPTCKSAIR